MSDLRSILEGLMQDGHLRPESVVQYATPEGSPLHEFFCWDDTQAAVQYRLQQARALIRSVTIEHTGNKAIQIRAFVSVPAERATGEGYRTIEDVLSTPFLRKQLAEHMLREAELWEQRARVFGLEIDTGPIHTLAAEVSGK